MERGKTKEINFLILSLAGPFWSAEGGQIIFEIVRDLQFVCLSINLRTTGGISAIVQRDSLRDV